MVRFGSAFLASSLGKKWGKGQPSGSASTPTAPSPSPRATPFIDKGPAEKPRFSLSHHLMERRTSFSFSFVGGNVEF